MELKDYADSLTYMDAVALSNVADPDVIVELRKGFPSDSAKRIDDLIAKGPTLTQPITIYRDLEDTADFFRQLESMTDKAFTAGTLTKPDTSNTVMAITVPVGTKVLRIDDVVILGRNKTLYLKDEGSIITASLVKPLKFAVLGERPINYLPEFHLTGQHDQSSHARGGGGGRAKGTSKMKSSTKKKVKKLGIIGAVAVAAAVLTFGLLTTPNNVEHNKRKEDTRHKKLKGNSRKREEERAKELEGIQQTLFPSRVKNWVRSKISSASIDRFEELSLIESQVIFEKLKDTVPFKDEWGWDRGLPREVIEELGSKIDPKVSMYDQEDYEERFLFDSID